MSCKQKTLTTGIGSKQFFTGSGAIRAALLLFNNMDYS